MTSRSERLRLLNLELIECRACPRLVAWREWTATEKRAAHRDEEYWGRPVPSFGDPDARVLVVGLAPAAHGANRTGRMFTGDRSGDWLFASLYRTGFANQPASRSVEDGLELDGVWITAMNHCAPPDNQPTREERAACRRWLDAELDILLPQLEVIVALGGMAWNATLGLLADRGLTVPRPRPKFAHLAEVDLGEITVLGSYHPSQQNTFTGRLTTEMLDEVFGGRATTDRLQRHEGKTRTVSSQGPASITPITVVELPSGSPRNPGVDQP